MQLAKSCQATTYCPADEVSRTISTGKKPCSLCSGLWFCLFSGFASSNPRSLCSGFFKILRVHLTRIVLACRQEFLYKSSATVALKPVPQEELAREVPFSTDL